MFVLASLAPRGPGSLFFGSRAIPKAKIIAIAGGSCSGKTTLVRHLASCLGKANCALIAQDSYFHDQSDALKSIWPSISTTRTQ